VRAADARRVQLGHAGTADGRWRLYAFAGADDAGLLALCRFLAEAAASPLRRHTGAGQDPDAVFDLRAVFQRSHRELAIESMPPLLLPRKGRLGLRDYEKVFAADPNDDIFERRAIDRERGALVVVRPDQYVAHVLPLQAHGALADFFARFMLPR
jgi:hypothetical protein